MFSTVGDLLNRSCRVGATAGIRRWNSSARVLRPSHAFIEEDLGRYRRGGYHPVRIGDTFHSGQYKVVSKLGYGLYATVWLATNVKTNKLVALKVLTADSSDGKNDTFELEILRHIRAKSTTRDEISNNSDRILGLLDEFHHLGPNGKHLCLVFKPMGPSLSEYRRLFPRLRIPVLTAKKISKDLLIALTFLHETCHAIHTDIKPQNILIETPEINDMLEHAPTDVFSQQSVPMDPPNDFYMASEPITSGSEDLATSKDISVKLTDFGVASWVDKHLTEWIQPEKLRAPEVILEAAWDEKADIWNLGLVIWELVQGQLCFDGQATATAPYSPEAHLAQMIAILGKFPTDLIQRSRLGPGFFGPHGYLRGDISFAPRSLKALNAQARAVSGEDGDNFVEFIESMLALDPRDRLKARDLLRTKWLQDVDVS